MIRSFIRRGRRVMFLMTDCIRIVAGLVRTRGVSWHVMGISTVRIRGSGTAGRSGLHTLLGEDAASGDDVGPVVEKGQGAGRLCGFGGRLSRLGHHISGANSCN